MNQHDPVVLELAPLPREQIGPFLILGVDKDVDQERIEAAWAKRVILARKNQIRITLEDINWAREILNDSDKRVGADVASLTADTADGLVRKLAARYGAGSQQGLAWQPLDREKDLRDYTPAVEVPDVQTVQAAVPLPAVPTDTPAALALLRDAVKDILDPWALELVHDGAAS